MKLEARVTHFERDNLVGLGTVKLGDGITLNNVRVVQSEKGMFVAVPSYKTNKLDDEGKPLYADHYNPITAEMKQMFDEAVEMAYGSEDGKSQLERELPGVPEKQGTIALSKYGVNLATDKDSNVKGYASVVVDDQFALNGIKLIKGNKGLFVALPSYPTNNIDEYGKPVYENHYNLSKEVFSKVKEVVLEGYKQALAAAKEQSKDGFKSIPESLGKELSEDMAAAKKSTAKKSTRKTKQQAEPVKKANKAFSR